MVSNSLVQIELQLQSHQGQEPCFKHHYCYFREQWMAHLRVLGTMYQMVVTPSPFTFIPTYSPRNFSVFLYSKFIFSIPGMSEMLKDILYVELEQSLCTSVGYCHFNYILPYLVMHSDRYCFYHWLKTRISN